MNTQPMTSEPTPQHLIFGVIASVYCAVISTYSSPFLNVMPTWDVVLTICVKVAGTLAALSTVLGFIFKYEAKIKRGWSALRKFFNNL